MTGMPEPADFESTTLANAKEPVAKANGDSYNFSLRHVQAFLSLARQGSFTLAARDMHLTQSGLSRVIASLEKEVGEELFVRASNTLRLSPAGKAFLPFARKLEACYAHALEVAAPNQERTPLSVACSCMVVSCLLALLPAANSLQACPQWRVKAMSSHKVLHAVRNGDTDLGICMIGQAPDDLNVEELFSASLGLIASPDVKLPDSIHNLQDIQGLPYARLDDSMVLPGLLRHAGVVLPEYFNAPLVSDSMPSLMSAIEAGRCVTLVSSIAAQHALARGLIFVPLPDLLPRMSLSMVFQHGFKRSSDLSWARCVAQRLARGYGALAGIPPA